MDYLRYKGRVTATYLYGEGVLRVNDDRLGEEGVYLLSDRHFLHVKLSLDIARGTASPEDES